MAARALRTALLGGALSLAVLAAAASAANATDFCYGNGFVLEVGAAGANAAYVAIDETYYGYWSMWDYAETNGVPGLQRGGITLLGDADICQDYENHDQGIF